MKQFSFKLQAVLDYRSEQLERVQQKVAQEEKNRMDIVHKIEGIDQTVQQAFEDYNKTLQQQSLDVVTSRQFSQYVELKKAKRKIYESHLCEQEKVLNKNRLELQAHLIRKKSLDLLKEKHYKQFLKNIEKEEEKFLSEIALNRMAR